MAKAKTAGSTKAKAQTGLPPWLERALQGVVFWMGLKRAYYAHYNLSEGAIVDELTSLLAATIGASGTGYKVTRELKKERLTGQKSKKGRGRKPAVDIAVERGGRGAPSEPVMCLEVKRVGNPFAGDIKKLAGYKKTNGGSWRAFVIVVGDKRPTDLVTDNGFAKKAPLTTKAGFPYAVRRVCKAIPTARLVAKKPKKPKNPPSVGTGFWVCALEVL